jgi:hypothetical protein
MAAAEREAVTVGAAARVAVTAGAERVAACCRNRHPTTLRGTRRCLHPGCKYHGRCMTGRDGWTDSCPWRSRGPAPGQTTRRTRTCHSCTPHWNGSRAGNASPHTPHPSTPCHTCTHRLGRRLLAQHTGRGRCSWLGTRFHRRNFHRSRSDRRTDLGDKRRAQNSAWGTCPARRLSRCNQARTRTFPRHILHGQALHGSLEWSPVVDQGMTLWSN